LELLEKDKGEVGKGIYISSGGISGDVRSKGVAKETPRRSHVYIGQRTSMVTDEPKMPNSHSGR